MKEQFQKLPVNVTEKRGEFAFISHNKSMPCIWVVCHQRVAFGISHQTL